MKYDEACQYGKEVLQESLLRTPESMSGVFEADDVAREALLLLEFVCHTKRSDLYVRPERELTPGEEETYKEVIAKRAAHVPYAYITGETEFMGLKFAVTKDVLIPRQDTETLVEECMPHLHDGMTFMDLCTGSGCIALSLLKYSNRTTCVATDCLEAALSIAALNAKALQLADRIKLIQTDLFPKRTFIPPKGVDLIVSNPPYIVSDVIETLSPEVAVHEPHMALDGGPDGILFYRRILQEAGTYLARGGMLLVEIGYDQGESVPKLFRDAGFRDVQTIRDLAKHPRVVSGVFYR